MMRPSSGRPNGEGDSPELIRPLPGPLRTAPTWPDGCKAGQSFPLIPRSDYWPRDIVAASLSIVNCVTLPRLDSTAAMLTLNVDMNIHINARLPAKERNSECSLRGG